MEGTWWGRLFETRLSSCLETYSMAPPAAFMAATACGMPPLLLFFSSCATRQDVAAQCLPMGLLLQVAGCQGGGLLAEGLWQALVGSAAARLLECLCEGLLCSWVTAI